MATPPTTGVKQPLTTLEALILSLISAAAGVGVGFGAIGTGTAGTVTAIAGIVGGALLQIANALHVTALAKSGLLRR